MNRQNLCVVAILALALAAYGQEQKDERIEVKVVGPTGGITTIEPVEIELEDVNLDGAVGSVILGVEGKPQDADEKAEKRKARRQDADKDGTIIKEIDLGDGRTMRIVISTKKGEAKTRTVFGATPEGMQWFHAGEKGYRSVSPEELREKMAGPEGMKGFKVEKLAGPEGKGFQVFGGEMSPFLKDFRFEGLGGDVKEQMERALKAFDRAREEFIRAYKEGDKDAKEKRPAPERRMRLAKPQGRVMIGEAEGEKEDEAAEKAEKAKAEVAESHEKQVEKIKARMEEELKRNEAKARRGAVQWVDTVPGASTKGEIESLRREIKELEKMVRDLKEQLEKK